MVWISALRDDWRTTEGSRDMTVDKPGVKLPLILLGLALTGSAAAAQTLPWPTDPPPPQSTTAPWPTAPAPAPMVAAPSAAVAPRPMTPPSGGPPADCMPKFNELRAAVDKLRDSVDKVAASARSKSEKKASREDVCAAITSYAAAESRWAKYTVDNTTRCGIPPEFGKQLTAANAKTQTVRKRVCSAGPAGGAPAAPSLSDALGTTRRTPDAGSQGKSGTFNTLTGNAVAK
jgi:hypothetical protein